MKTIKVHGLFDDFVVIFPTEAQGKAFESEMIDSGDGPMDYAEIDVTARAHKGVAVKLHNPADAAVRDAVAELVAMELTRGF